MIKCWYPKDIIAIVIVISSVGLIFTGRDGFVGTTLIAIVAAYYGIDLTPWFKVGRNQGKNNDDEVKQ